MAHYSCRHGRKTRRNSTFELFFSERLSIFQNEMTLFKDLRSRKVLLFVPIFFAGVVVQGLKSMLAKLCICSLSNPVFLRKFQSCREFPLLTEHSTTPSWPQRGLHPPAFPCQPCWVEHADMHELQWVKHRHMSAFMLSASCQGSTELRWRRSTNCLQKEIL